jgi:hypothetical protein
VPDGGGSAASRPARMAGGLRGERLRLGEGLAHLFGAAGERTTAPSSSESIPSWGPSCGRMEPTWIPMC